MPKLEQRKYPLSPRMKNLLLDSAKRLGCRLSDFNVIAFSNAGSLVDLAWDLDDNLRISLKLKNNKTYLEQTFKGKPQNVPIPVRCGNELPPALQFSDSGICQLTYGNCWRIVQQLNLFKQLGKLLPFLPLHLSQLFKDAQDQLKILFEADWQLKEAVAVRSSKIEMVRQLNFGEHTVDLIIILSEKGSQEFKVLLQVCSIDKQAHIPEYLKLSVFDESYGKTVDVKAPGNEPGIEQRWTFDVGEKFSVTVELDGVTVTENFVI